MFCCVCVVQHLMVARLLVNFELQGAKEFGVYYSTSSEFSKNDRWKKKNYIDNLLTFDMFLDFSIWGFAAVGVVLADMLLANSNGLWILPPLEFSCLIC